METSGNNLLEMGCLCTRVQNKEISREEVFEKKTYSWDERKKLFNPKDFIIEDLIGQEEIRLPGSVKGQQFIIQNCKDSTIYILDYINTVTIDDCSNCKIILGPVEGSTFIRNCTSCTCVVASGQFRVRDSTKLNIFLFSATQPIIEASSGIQFGSYQLKYNGIQEHFQKTNLNGVIKNWKFIYDFTPVECEENWSFMRNCVLDFVPPPQTERVKNELMKLNHSWSYIEISENPTSQNNIFTEKLIDSFGNSEFSSVKADPCQIMKELQKSLTANDNLKRLLHLRSCILLYFHSTFVCMT